MAAGEEGKTLAVEVDGIPVTIERDVLGDDIETLELLADVDEGNALAVVRLMRHVFGDEQYANIKASLRRDGRTAVTDMTNFMSEVFKAIGGEVKN
jgi:hypothetical protein